QRRGGVLRQRKISKGGGIFRKREVLDVTGNADDLGEVRVSGELETFAQGILSGPHLFGHGLVDDNHLLAGGVIGGQKVAAFDQRYPHGRKIVPGRDALHRNEARGAPGLRGFALDQVAARKPGGGHGRAGGNRGRGHAGNGRGARLQLAQQGVERAGGQAAGSGRAGSGAGRPQRIAGGAKIEAQGRELVGGEAGVGALRLAQAREEQPGNDQRDQRQPHLADQQQPAQ